MGDALVDNLSLEAQAQAWGDKCAKYADEHDGQESPDLLFEYAKAVFAVAKRTSSLVDTQKVEEKQLPLENPKVKLAADASDEEVDATAAAESNDGKDGEPDNTAAADAENADAAEDAALPADAEDAEDSEPEDDFVFAFQIADSCRVLYSKLEQTREVKEKLARTHELLGDIAIEDDNAQQAVEDYASASRLKHELYGAESGEYSETEFMLSLAYDTVGDSQQSLEHLRLAAGAARAAKLAAASELEQRVVDLEQELRIAKKIGDKNAKKAQETTKESISGRNAIANAVQGLVSGANDISQLTRKRKRPDTKSPQPEPEPSVPKKQ